MNNQIRTLYEDMGGEKVIAQLVDAFYDRVAVHPELSPIFPEDLTETREKQFAFLSQYFGGPSLYNDQYGHPMMRARHLPFPITPSRARAWLHCMSEAMDEVGLEGMVREQAFARLTMTAHHMVNQEDEI